MIFYDPTEARTNSKMPDNVLSAGVPLEFLERYTGADLLISALEEPKLTTIADNKLGQLILRKHTESGILVQRKSGSDALSSIPNYTNILAKMMDWCEKFPPWLVLTGEFTSGTGGKVVLDGHGTNWTYAAFQGALESWQTRTTEGAKFSGGGVTILCRDAQLGPWVARWYDKVRATEKPITILPQKPTSFISTPKPDDPRPWRATLMTFPGIGIELATEIANYCGTLKDSLMFLSDTAHFRLREVHAQYPKGIGVQKFSDARKWLGLENVPNGSEVLCSTVNPLEIYKYGVPGYIAMEKPKPVKAPKPVVKHSAKRSWTSEYDKDLSERGKGYVQDYDDNDEGTPF